MKDISVNDIIEDWEEHECIIHCDSIMHRLLELADWASEDEEDADMEVPSLLDALQFLNSRPSLTLDPNGCINASFDIYDHKLIIRFEGHGTTQALLTKTD